MVYLIRARDGASSLCLRRDTRGSPRQVAKGQWPQLAGAEAAYCRFVGHAVTMAWAHYRKGTDVRVRGEMTTRASSESLTEPIRDLGV
jgi:hypothetical protein